MRSFFYREWTRKPVAPGELLATAGATWCGCVISNEHSRDSNLLSLIAQRERAPDEVPA